jgi:hypothetical protein
MTRSAAARPAIFLLVLSQLTGILLAQELHLETPLATPASQALQIEPAAAAPSAGFPNWEERVMHQWINRARVEPAVELEGCGSNCSVAEMLPSCYTPVPPLMLGHELSVAARFHADSMALQNFFAHNTPCTLRTDLAEVYPASCDGSAVCSCSGSGSTSPSGRLSRFGAYFSGEIIAAGYSDAVSAFYGWLHEPVSSSAPCAYSNYSWNDTNGHRWLILKASGSLGPGIAAGGAWGKYYVTDFGGAGTHSRIPSGVHYPRQAPTVELWANWYDEQAPSQARVVVGSQSYPMLLDRGSATNGAWTTQVSGVGTGCHRYYFEFTASNGQLVRHPESGTFGIGPLSTCAEWQDSANLPASTITAVAVTTSSVQVSWTSSSGASQYQLERSTAGVPFAPLATVSATGYLDSAASPGKTYLYRVRPLGGSTWSNVDHATTIVFADDPLVANTTPIKAVHITQLRTAVNAVRAAAGLSSFSWTNATPAGAPVRSVHILELRSALSAALSAFGQSANYTYPVKAGEPLRAIDFQEIRNALK